MNKKISQHKKFIEDEVSKATSTKDIDLLFKINSSAISNFQAERFIHILITLFFALFTLIFISLYVLTNIPIFWIPSALTAALLLPYIFHYYGLENGIQSLYELEKKMFEKRGELENIRDI